MRSSRCLVPLAVAACLLFGTMALAADDDEYSESDEYSENDEYAATHEELELRGILSAGYVHSFQDTDLKSGSFDDGNGSNLSVGFQAGHYLAFLLDWEWQTRSDYDTHFFPFSVRMMSPSLLDRVRLYGQFGIGLFFSQLHGGLGNDPEVDNERGSAVRAGGGVEVGLYDDLSAIVYGGYLWGLGSTDDYKYGSVGVGLQWRWNF